MRPTAQFDHHLWQYPDESFPVDTRVRLAPRLNQIHTKGSEPRPQCLALRIVDRVEGDVRDKNIENAELVCLETAVSALSSSVGQALIPVPVLGAVIGNTVGIIMYRTVSSSLSKREEALILHYLSEQRALDEQLAAEYRELIEKLDASMSDYLGVLERAFSPDIEVALLGSVELALELGVATEEILNSDEKVLTYFLD